MKRFFVVEFLTATQDFHLPDTGLVVALRIGGECSMGDGVKAPSAGITGIWDRLRSHIHSQGNANLLASFTPLGAAAFFREPLSEFSNRTADLSEVLSTPIELGFLQEQIYEAQDHRERVGILEQFLLGRANCVEFDPIVREAVSTIENRQAMIRIPELARQVGLSQSALERRFKHRVGTSPKKFASLVRLQHVLRLRAQGSDLSTIAHAAGYCDQSHFIKDFRQVTGHAPESYFRFVASR